MRRILGITAEYDPFHNGHIYQLERAREQVDPDAVLCVMSGDFTQRGEPAVLDKWTRARLAAQHGADLVFELPFACACNRAERFAAGAVDLLAAAGATHISFGCEAEHPEELQRLAEVQIGEADRMEELVREYMKDGYSKAKASEMSSRRLLGDEMTDLMLKPNNILALEYMKRILWWEKERGVSIRTVPIPRFGSGYDEADPSRGFAGGKSIRQMIAAGEDFAVYLPYDPEGLPWEDLPEARQRMYEILRAIILRSTPEQLAKIYCIGEGMEHRLLREAKKLDCWEEFLASMVSKRYTAAAIQRVMVYLLMNIDEMPDFGAYGRVLAANETGRRLLRMLEDASGEKPCEKTDRKSIPGESPREEMNREMVFGDSPQGRDFYRPPLTVIANGNRLEGVSEKIREALELDERAADMFHLICGRNPDRYSDRRQRPWMGP